jgi:hypothetical protein
MRIADVGRWAAAESRLLPSSALAVVVLVESALPPGPWTSARVAALLRGAEEWCRRRRHHVPAGLGAAVWVLIEHDHRLGGCHVDERAALQAVALAHDTTDEPGPAVHEPVHRRLHVVPPG